MLNVMCMHLMCMLLVASGSVSSAQCVKYLVENILWELSYYDVHKKIILS